RNRPALCLLDPYQDIAGGRVSSPIWDARVANGRLGEDAEALWYVAPGRVEIRRETVPAPGPGEVLVRALHGAISRGTERLVLAGRAPAGGYARLHGPPPGGDFPLPRKYAYAPAGRGPAGTPTTV